MRYLVDTSVWLQSLLKQTDAAEADAFITAWEPPMLAISDFAWNSIGVRCAKRNQLDLYVGFSQSVIVTGGTVLLRLDVSDAAAVVSAMRNYNLSYDDAYQYVTAEKHGLRVVALDNDFRKTPRGHLRPRDAMPPQNGQQP